MLFGHKWELFEAQKEEKDITVQDKSFRKCDLRPCLKIVSYGRSVAIGVCGCVQQDESVERE